jgi:hypothetical protein
MASEFIPPLAKIDPIYKEEEESFKVDKNGFDNLSCQNKCPFRTYRVIKVSLVQVFSCSNTGSIRDCPQWTSRENSLELIELSSINKVSLV